MARRAADWASLPADVHLAVQRHLSLTERWVGGGARGAPLCRHAPPTRPPPRARRCRCLCVCRAWHAASAGLPELWDSVCSGDQDEYECVVECKEPMLRWLAAWCATPQRPLRWLSLNLSSLVIAPDVAAGLVEVLRRSSTSLQHLGLVYSDSLGDCQGHGDSSCVLPPPSTVLPASLERLVYHCGELPLQVSQLTRLEHLSARTPPPASLVLPPSLRALDFWCREIPAQLSQLTRLEELTLRGYGGVCETSQHATALARLPRVRVLLVAGAGCSCTHCWLTEALCPCRSHHWSSTRATSWRCPPAGPR